jgi:hypothetical protein
MLRPLQKLPQDQTLVAHSGVQFIDYGFRLDEEFSFNRNFLEIPEAAQDDSQSNIAYRLQQIETNRAGPGYVDVETKLPVTEKSTYSIQFARALEIFDSVWLPTPYLKHKGYDGTSRETFEQGPFNWCRLRITKLSPTEGAADDYTHRLTLAFDTTTGEAVKGWPYISPVNEDVRNASRFYFASELRDISWFLYQRWVTGWLQEEIKLSSAAVKPVKRGDGEDAECTYWAYYATLLQGLRVLMNGKSSNALMPRVYFINTLGTSSEAPIDVDLVLDIGNSRTCGVLIETGAGDELDIENAASVLQLRDLSKPELSYREPFRSHVEFAPAEFGNTYRSRESGRNGIFKWPSWVRVGPEALRLCDKSSGAEGDTGISGPKRYIWDERENRQPWLFNIAESRLKHNSKVFGDLMLLVTDDGEPIKSGANSSPALDPKFSRASLFTFMVIELVLQAIVQINSVDYRAVKKHPNVNRRLRNILFTIPTATPLLEKERYQHRCEAAISLLWEAYEWNLLPKGIVPLPDVSIAYDEATCTQIVYLYNEIAKKLELTPTEMFKLLGRKTSGNSTERLRIASMDIGGGTTDLMIVTYAVDPPGSDALAPMQNFREGFRKAGDDILEAVISRHVLKAIEIALANRGVPNPTQILQEFMSPGRNALQRQLRKVFVSRILTPIALHLLSQYETAANLVNDVRDQVTFRSILRDHADTLQRAIRFFEDPIHAAGATEFSLLDVEIGLDFDRLGSTIQSVMGDIIAIMCEVIHKFDCDVLLLTGRPSCFPMIRDLVLRYLPIAPHRLIFMHEYKVGKWYPFVGRNGKIDDPKTTVVVGALICALAENRKIRDFPLRGGGFSIKSTARYIGRLLGADTIRTEDVIFSRETKAVATESNQLVVSAPMFLGFRQLKLDRWPGTPLFFLDLAEDHPARRSAPMPWLVTFRRNEPLADDPVAKQELDLENLWVDRVVDQTGNDVSKDLVRIRLQTMRNVEGYWLDTGTVTIAEAD